MPCRFKSCLLHHSCTNKKENRHEEKEKTMSRALLLNASFEPLAIIPDRRMLIKYMAGTVEPIEHSGRVFHSEKMAIMIPSVARLYKYVKLPSHHHTVLLNTRAVLARDDYTCGYCGLTGLTTGPNGNGTMDHVKARANGGLHTWANVTASCKKCNLKKSHHTLEQMGWVLEREPTIPRGVSAYLLSKNPDPAWANYLQVA
jgi:5-methylcytosine-specific restriction endonuclease McrA